LPGCLLALVREVGVELLGPPAERAGDAADPPVSVEREDTAVAPFEELRQRVLHQRQRAGLLGDVCEHRGHERRLERDVDALRRTGDRAFELIGRERDHRLHARAEQLREAPVQERAIVEVGPERHDDAVEAVRVAFELVGHAGRGIRHGAKERGLEPVERMRSREHVDDPPAIGAGDRAAPEGRDEARTDD
jgi:hypothetical protein